MNGTELIFTKIIVTTSIVLILSSVTEHVSPKWAGILSGLPTGTAITLYFYALENGPEFAGESAIYNMIGLVAMQICIFCYYVCGVAAKKHKLFFSICGAIIGYLFSIVYLSQLHVTPIIAITIPVISFVIFKLLFSKINHSKIIEKIRPTWSVYLGRAGLATLIVCLVTGIAKIVGTKWAGLFSAFPSTLFPLLLIIHFSYGERYAHSIIKYVPEGLGGLLIYSLIIYACYPRFGLYSGIALAFTGALLYLFIYQFVTICFRTAKPTSARIAEQ